jgi:hypothetical protein
MRAKILLTSVLLLLVSAAVSIAIPQAEPPADMPAYCGEDCVSCVEHDDGGITCCAWSGGRFLGCETEH